MQVDAATESVPGQQQRLRAARGVMTIESFECEKVRYTARNQDTAPRQLVIEHPRREGWQLMAGGPSPAESSTAAHRFQIPVAPSATATLVVAAYRPAQSSIRIISLNDEQLQVYIRQGAIDAKTREALEAIVVAKRALAQIEEQAVANQSESERIDKDQQRLRENMKSLKGSSEEKQLVERYVRQLNDQEDRLATLRTERSTLDGKRDERTRALVTQIDALSVEPGTVAAPCRG
jgi:chromosome segregation ATPase